ncbi:hypothetical protein [Liquorilactobacillus uvarum]|uniref:hypothetical protein n=1 Tax=Liquorilactobacillus uvarum TaxID=303240 RepID=UPI002889EA7C|nr:hypothetical protein [Liquorilactobacillus uvarum]
MVNLPTLNLQNLPDGFLDRNAFSIQNNNIDKLNNYGGNISTWLQGVVDGYNLRFDNMIQNSEQVNEVVDARVNIMGNVYPTLKAHLDGIETDKVSGVQDGDVAVNRTIQLKGLTESSAHIHVTGKYSVDYQANGEGLMITNVANIGIQKVGS